MRVLLTGHKGFVGTHLEWALNHHTLFTCDPRGGINLHSDKSPGWGRKSSGGITTADFYAFDKLVETTRPELIVHLGASCSTRISIENPRRDFTANAVGTFNVAEVARQRGNIPVLYTSTCKVEAGADGLVAPLGLSKWVGEEYLRTFNALYGLPYVILQPSTIYGPGQQGDRNLGWVSHFIRCAVEGIQPEVFGTGNQSRDILYIDDFVKLIADIVDNFALYAGHTYPVGGGRDNELSIVQLLHHLGVGTTYKRSPAIPSDLDRVVQDNSAVSSVTGWRPTTHWREGVHRTKEAMR